MSTTTTHIETEKKLAPALRFKEFEKDWTSFALKDITPIDEKYGIVDGPFGSNLKTIHYKEEGVPIITSGYVTNGYFYAKKYLFVTPEKFLKEKRSAVRAGDIVMAKIGARCGASAIFPKNHETSILSGNALKITVDESRFSTMVIWQQLYHLYSTHKIDLLKTVGAQPAISIANLKKFKVVVPKLLEQQKIASFLSAVDEKIQQLTKKKSLLEQYKKGVMQQLFSGQLRFKDENGNDFPDWEEKKIGNFLIHKSTKNKDLQVSLVLSVSNKKGFISQNEQFDGYEVASKDLSNYKIVNRDDIAYNPSRINVGSIARLIKFEKGIVSPMYVVFSLKDDLDKIYFKNLYNIHRFRHLIKVGCSGSVRDSLNFDDLCGFQFKFPSIQEQQKIATYLSRIDTKIEQVNNQITQTQTFKKGLLQQMFV